MKKLKVMFLRKCVVDEINSFHIVLTKPFGEVRDAEVKVMDASFSDTNRLAIKNCDWENISARDLL